MSEFVNTAKQEIADQLGATAYFEAVPILVEQLKDIDFEIEKAIESLGLCIVVMAPLLDASFPDVFGPFFDDISFVAMVIQNPKIDASGLDALDVAVNIAYTLHQFQPASLNSPLTIRKPSITISNHKTLVMYLVHFQGRGGIRTAPTQVATPANSNASGTITLTCATTGAAIFYKTDGTNPSTSATLYTAPFTPAGGSLVKARAYLAGKLASELMSLQL